jgi:outer membrane immunogenic protein
MRKVLLSTAAMLFVAAPSFAADMPYPDMKAPAPMAPAPVVYDWTGLHFGGHVGYGWSSNKWTRIQNAQGGGNVGQVVGTHSADGFLGGLQLGYSFQWDQFVLGIEGDVSWTGMDGKSTWLGGPGGVVYRDGQTDYDWMATLAVRAGVAFDRTLVYLKGGGAWADVDYAHVGGGVNNPRLLTGSKTRSGWLVGAGIEHAFLDDWSVKLEYNYMDFGSKAIALSATDGGPGPAIFNVKSDAHTLKLGINYRFSTY